MAESDVAVLSTFIRANQDRAQVEDARMVLVVDALEVGSVPPAVRKGLAEMTEKTSPEVEKFTLKTVLMLKSTLVRGAFTALGWLVPSIKSSTATAATVEDAVGLVEEIYAKAEVALPSSFDAFAARRAS